MITTERSAVNPTVAFFKGDPAEILSLWTRLTGSDYTGWTLHQATVYVSTSGTVSATITRHGERVSLFPGERPFITVERAS